MCFNDCWLVSEKAKAARSEEQAERVGKQKERGSITSGQGKNRKRRDCRFCLIYVIFFIVIY